MSTKLFTPVVVGDKQLQNRIALAPLTRGRADEQGVVKDIHAQYYSQRASAGLLITEATNISDLARGWNGAPGIYTAEQTQAWKSVTQAVHEKDSSIWIQLWHTGRASHSDFHKNAELPVAASAIAISGEVHTPQGKKPYEVPHSLTVEEIKATVQDYKRAAENAKQAGFDGVEIHSANGYLLDNFLQSKTNQRTDEYGGSFENRFRFLREVIEAILSVLPSNKVALRLSPNGIYNDMGSADFRESFSYYIQEIAKYNLGYIHVLDGLMFGFHNLGEPFTLKDVRKNYSGIIIANCGYTLEAATNAVELNDADLVAFGRPFISNPDLVERFKNNWSLAEDAPISVWYNGGAAGYTDFPVYAAAL
jgi:N-ethylmaleimide reductase